MQDLARLVVDELELRQIAATDSLTGAQTRRSFHLEVKKEMERAKRFNRSAGFIAMDIDHFKTINDTHGHQASDAVLQNFAAICKASLRSIDLFARLGGEEFVIVLPETGHPGAMEVAERLRQNIAATPISGGENQISVTASFGVTEFLGKDETVQSILERADSALYKAKAGGRNRTVYLGGEGDEAAVA